ncbi:hypothetical protein O3M35_005936 [Rhynocoris fuscipes]|uniref:Uncharacterized protein n=1 Tax=Rhynocoris fuscipes TaxID=488301 RepID=A0AAW1DIQ1_9HEMI
MQNNNRRCGGWVSKLVAISLAVIYLITVSLVHNSPYIWLSLILVLMLCLTSFAYTRDKPLIRWNSRNNSQTNNQNEQEPEMTEVPAAIWMSDVPPTYSNVIAANNNNNNNTQSPPVTPPPSYGSALVMFPWLANGQQSPDVSRLIENARFRSVSRQVSEISGNFNCNSSISRQTSRIDSISAAVCADSLTRQATLKLEDISTVRQLSAISRQISHATVLSRQISLQENKQQQEQKEKDENCIVIAVDSQQSEITPDKLEEDSKKDGKLELTETNDNEKVV